LIAPSGFRCRLASQGIRCCWLLTFDISVFSMRPRKGTGLQGSAPRGGVPLLGKEAPLNRKELVDAIQKHTEVARADVDKVLGSLIMHTEAAIKRGDRVSLVGFGTFERRDRKARVARNPRSGETVRVRATKVPVFRAGQSFRDIVAGRAAAPRITAPRPAGRAAARATPRTTTRTTTTTPRATRTAAARSSGTPSTSTSRRTTSRARSSSATSRTTSARKR
jgi:DNA-binding protein HU-beta